MMRDNQIETEYDTSSLELIHNYAHTPLSSSLMNGSIVLSSLKIAHYITNMISKSLYYLM